MVSNFKPIQFLVFLVSSLDECADIFFSDTVAVLESTTLCLSYDAILSSITGQEDEKKNQINNYMIIY